MGACLLWRSKFRSVALFLCTGLLMGCVMKSLFLSLDFARGVAASLRAFAFGIGVGLLGCALGAESAFAQQQIMVNTPAQKFKAVKLMDGLHTPWALAFLPDGKALLAERSGNLLVLHPGAADGAWSVLGRVSGLPANVAVGGQGGLLDVALHPQFRQNRWVYLSYVGRDARGLVGTELLRARLSEAGPLWSLTQSKTIFQMRPKTATGVHFGGRIVFDRAGMVYLTLGDRGEMERAQKPGDHAGSVIRLYSDGRVPLSNPWYGGRNGYLPEKFDLGHRNMQGAALHPRTGQLWTHEHGPKGGDEINIIGRGRNYGWPVITYGIDYSGAPLGEGVAKPGMEQPLYKWVPSIAPSGMAFYTGAALAGWVDNLFVGALAGQALVRLRLGQSNEVLEEERLLQNQIGRIRDVRQGPDGLLYLLTDADPGQLWRLQP